MITRKGGPPPAAMLVLAAISSVQLGSALARSLFDEVGSAGAVLLRLTLAALIIVVALRPKIHTWSRASWQAAVLLGVATAGMNLAFYLAIRSVPLGIAVTVEFTGPLLLALVQTRRWLDLLWAMLAVSGVLLLGVDPGDGVAFSGLALAATAGLFWAGYIVANARLGQALPGLDGLAAALVVGAVLALPFGLSGALTVVHKPVLLIPAAGVALLSSVLPYSLELTALRRMPTQVFGILMSLEPAGAALAGWIVLGQGLGLRAVAALLMVTLASGGVTVSGMHRVDADVEPLS